MILVATAKSFRPARLVGLSEVYPHTFVDDKYITLGHIPENSMSSLA